ncbi:MAG: glycosyltransferase family 4 protein [Candidatus Krumholzibacteriota bacterium]|nr:glycosyltransferase family 4 protein [Candidatus Krumholzibacteriota bacterium]
MSSKGPVKGRATDEMRLCRIASYPTSTSPGTGLPGYYLCRAISTPTLFLTGTAGEFLDIPPHVDFRAIRYSSPPLGEKANLLRALAKLPGLLKFFLLSLGPLTRFKPHLVHIHSPLYIMHALWAKIFLRARICMTFHGSDILRIKRSPPLRALLPALVDLFFYVSSSMEPELLRFLPPARIIHTPNGVDSGLFRDLGRKRENQLVAVGNLRWQKGYRYLIDAFAALSPPGYRLVIVGEGPLREDLQRRIDRHALRDRIRLVGRKNHREIIEILNSSKIFVMSSVSEGFPKALLEGISAGLPVVTTDVGCCREISRGVGLCVPPADSSALAEACGKLIADDKLRTRLAARTSSTAGRYGWEESCRIVERAYRNLLSPVPRPLPSASRNKP